MVLVGLVIAAVQVPVRHAKLLSEITAIVLPARLALERPVFQLITAPLINVETAADGIINAQNGVIAPMVVITG